MARQILLSTTGTLSPVVIADFGARSFLHPTVNFNLLDEFREDEIQSSVDLQAVLTAGHITLVDDNGNSITDVTKILPVAHDASHEDGGYDEINVSDLDGVLADPQHPSVVGDTPPGSPSNGDLWFKTPENVLYYYDETRGKWLSIKTQKFGWGHDTADGNLLRAYGVNIPQSGQEILVPVNSTVTGVYAKARGGDATKQFTLLQNGGAFHTFSLAAGVYKNLSLNLDLSADDGIWVEAAAAGIPATGVTVFYIIQRRG